MATTRREAARLATHKEILDTARRLLADGGRTNVTLRAVAAEIGMTAPGIYRYFDSHDQLLAALTDAIAGELADALEAARDTHQPPAAEARITAVCRGFRRWAVAHQREYELLFGLPSSPPGEAPMPVAERNGPRISGVFLGCFLEVWRKRRFPVPGEEDLRPELISELSEFVGPVDDDVPVGVLRDFVDCWVRLYGLVTLEVFGHLRFALRDVRPLFEATLSEMGARMGFTVPEPDGSPSVPPPEVS